MRKKIISIILAASMLPCAGAGASDIYATRGEVADMLLIAADDYNPTVKRSDIIKGYGGALNAEFTKASNEFNEKFLGI